MKTVLAVGWWVFVCASPARANVLISPVEGAFYGNPAHGCAFAPEDGDPVFTQPFGSLNFNPPSTWIPGSPVSPSSQGFFNVQTNPDGFFLPPAVQAKRGILAPGTDGDFKYFYASFTGRVIVDGSQQVTFKIYHDDGFIFGIGGDARRVSGDWVLPPPGGFTKFKGLQVVGAYNISSIPRLGKVVVQFAGAGEYDFEIDYTSCRGATRSLTVFVGDNAIPMTLGTPTQTATTTPTVTDTPTPVTPSPTGSVIPHATGTATGSPPATATPTRTATPTPPPTQTPTPTPTPTVTPLRGVGLAMTDASGHPGDTVTLTISFTPGPADGQFGPANVVILGFTLSYPSPDLQFDATDTHHSGIPDAIVLNPAHNEQLGTFSASISAAADGIVDIEFDASEDTPLVLPAGPLMTIAFTIAARTAGGDFRIVPTNVRAYDINASEYPATSLQVGVVHASPPPSPTANETPVKVGITTSGGGCTAAAGDTSAAAPLVMLAALALARRLSRSRPRA